VLQRIALVFHREPPYRNVVDPFDAGREIVAPGDVIGRAGGPHLDLRVPREMLRDSLLAARTVKVAA
jgi:hypothetical protein